MSDVIQHLLIHGFPLSWKIGNSLTLIYICIYRKSKANIMFNVESLDFFSLTLRECKFYHLYANFTRNLKEIERKNIKIGKKKQNSVYSSIYMIVYIF